MKQPDEVDPVLRALVEYAADYYTANLFFGGDMTSFNAETKTRKEKMKPASYPFLAIARKYGLDYGDVLIYADIHKRPNLVSTYWVFQAIDNVSAVEPDYAAAQAIVDANAEFAAIQAGKIDYETGEPPLLAAEYIRELKRGETDDFRKVYYGALSLSELDLLKPLVTPLLDAATLKPVDCALCGQRHTTGTTCGEYSNGAPMYAPDGTLLDEKGNRSIFDDIDD